MRDLIVDGVPLRDPLGEWYLDYTRSQMLPELSRTYTSDPVFGFHGNPQSTVEEGYFGTGRETWVLNVDSSDIADHAVNINGLQGLMSRPDLQVLAAPQRTALASAVRTSAAFSGSADAVKFARMRQLGSTAIEYINESTCRLTFIMENQGPFWSSNPYYDAAAVTITATNKTLPLSTTLTNSSAPVVDGLVRIKGPLTAGGSVTIQDRGKPFRAIRYTATVALAATEYVVIDMATLNARLNTSAVWTLTTGTDVSARVTTNGEGAFFLTGVPASGWPSGNADFYAMAVSVGYTSGTTAVDFRLRRSYLA